MESSRLSVEEIWLSMGETKVTRIHRIVHRHESYTGTESQKSKVSSEVFIRVLVTIYVRGINSR